MRFLLLSAALAALNSTAVSAQNVGKFAICNNCVPTGSGAPVCTQNNYVHWGNEGDQGNCNDESTQISGACSEGTIDSPLGSGEVSLLYSQFQCYSSKAHDVQYTPNSDCDENASAGTMTGSVVGLRNNGPGVFKLNCYKEQDSFTDFCGFTFACNIFLVCRPG